ncbi:MAG: response regulator [Verrucomicrobiae bacterium]|jgi:PAS domain S-box-containing protein|nr:response regulator [Verrucomicrobiae bacterium]
MEAEPQNPRPAYVPPKSALNWSFDPARTHILVIDDEADNRDILQRLLVNAGFRCDCAATGTAGLRSLAENGHDLVVCDVRLPDRSGLEISREIKADPDTAHIFVALISSAETSSDSTIAGLGSGADEYIARPIRNRELVARVRALARIQQTSRALRESERRFLTLAKTAPTGIIRTDIHGRIVYVNDYWCELTDIPSDNALGHDWTLGLHPDDVPLLISAFEDAAARHTPMRCECRLRDAGGNIRWIISTASAELDGDGILGGYIGAIIDITERKTAEEALSALNQTLEKRVADRTARLARTNDILLNEIHERKRAEEALKQLPHRILEAQENERRRIARELHDGVSQILASVRFRCQMLTDRLGPDFDPSVMTELSATHGHLEAALREVRNISHDLRPSELDDLGLIPAIRSLTDHFRLRTGLTLKISAPKLRKRLPPEIELAAYRILQESLTNIERHARAGLVEIAVEKKRGSLTLTVRDDGCGFGPNTAGKSAGLGLVNMRERADFINGTVAIRSAPQDGTTIELYIPLPTN